jgi:hypothetical protein
MDDWRGRDCGGSVARRQADGAANLTNEQRPTVDGVQQALMPHQESE